MKSQGIPMLAFLIVAAICGAVGYVAGYAMNDDVRRQAESRGFLQNGKWLDMEEFEQFLTHRAMQSGDGE